MEELPEPPGVTAGLTREEREEEFLRLLSEGAKVRHAAHAVAIVHTHFYKKRKDDPAFAKRWEDAQRITVHTLENEAFRRAMNGSDKLMEVMLKAHAPAKYRERTEIQHSGGMSFNVFTGIPAPEGDVDDLL